MENIDHNLYAYTSIRNDRLFGIHGIINTSLAQEYIYANEEFVSLMNKISYSPDSKYTYSYMNLFNLNYKPKPKIAYKFIKVDESFNKLNINKLNEFILNKYVLAETIDLQSNNDNYMILNRTSLL